MRRRPSEPRARSGASLDVDVSGVHLRLPIAPDRVARAVRHVLRSDRVASAHLSVAFVSTARIAAMNLRHLGHPGATDVISFRLAPATRTTPLMGDIYIAPAVATANARARDISRQEELLRLVVHGTLHVLGYDHPDGGDRETSAMWKKQERLVRGLVRRFGPQ